MQWHPLFAHLLRPVIERHYEVQTNVAVSDVPREADILLLRRTTAGHPRYRSLWRHLTRWNILEFKAPTVSARRRDLDLLVELGLGIDRRLNDQRNQQRHRPVPEREVSFWYIVHRTGGRFLRDATDKLGRLESLSPGLRRSRLLAHSLFLVSSVDVPLDGESLPLHVAGWGTAGQERSLARLVLKDPKLRQTYSPWLFTLHKRAWKELQTMAHALGEDLEIDLKPLVEYLGVNRVIDEVGLARVIREVGLDRLFEVLTPEQRAELSRRHGEHNVEGGKRS